MNDSENKEYQKPEAEFIEFSADINCISTSVPIDDGTGNIDPGDIG